MASLACDQVIEENNAKVQETGLVDHDGTCAICLDKVALQETALVSGCEHAYCVTCILRWAAYTKKPTCPQCKHPFEFLNVHRSIDGSIHDYMFEESVCLLLRAPWFKPLVVGEEEEHSDDSEEYYFDEDNDEDGLYFSRSPSLRLGNRRWGGNGYVSAGRQEARPILSSNTQEASTSSSREPRRDVSPKGKIGRRARRALKREAAEKVDAAKHQKHLERFGRN